VCAYRDGINRTWRESV
jgi:hypothetical protein